MKNTNFDDFLEYLIVTGQVDENLNLKTEDEEEDEKEEEEENNYGRRR